jgi:cytochrome c
MRAWLVPLATLLVLALPTATPAQDLRGHGGPVGALDGGGGVLISGSFDTRAIFWDLASASARNVTRFHDGNVTAVALLPQGGFVTAGQDGRIAIWQKDGRAPEFATAPGISAIAALDVAPDGGHVAVGFWDGRVALLDIASQDIAFHQAHSDRVTGIGFLQGGDLVSVGGDFRLARWNRGLDLQARADLPDLPNGLAITQNRVAIIFAEGALRLFSDSGEMLPERFLTDRPLVALAANGKDIAAAAIDGTVWLLQGADLVQRQMFRAATGPVWGLALDGDQVFTAGADGVIRRWSLEDGTALGGQVLAENVEYTDDSRGAEIWQACAVCHSLAPNDHSRAGPSLHAIFGQTIATQQGYDYSPALQQLNIIWTPQTVAELFEFGPEAYTPGSRMPEQRISAAEDRQALVEFLARAAEAD